MLRVLKDAWRDYTYKLALAANKDSLYEEPVDSLRVYILVRTEFLPPLNQGIQAAHALQELSNWYNYEDIVRRREWERWSQQDKTLILLSADNSQMEECRDDAASYAKLPSRSFREPDLGGMLTAVAFGPCTKDIGIDIFGHLELAE